MGSGEKKLVVRVNDSRVEVEVRCKEPLKLEVYKFTGERLK